MPESVQRSQSVAAKPAFLSQPCIPIPTLAHIWQQYRSFHLAGPVEKQEKPYFLRELLHFQPFFNQPLWKISNARVVTVQAKLPLMPLFNFFPPASNFCKLSQLWWADPGLMPDPYQTCSISPSSAGQGRKMTSEGSQIEIQGQIIHQLLSQSKQIQLRKIN